MPLRHLLVAATFTLSMLLYVDRIAISTAKQPLTGDLGLTDTEFGWTLSAFALGYALFQTPAGALADRFGPRRVIAGIVAAWSLFTVLTGLAWSYGSRLGAAFALPLVAALVAALGWRPAFMVLGAIGFVWRPPGSRGSGIRRKSTPASLSLSAS